MTQLISLNASLIYHCKAKKLWNPKPESIVQSPKTHCKHFIFQSYLENEAEEMKATDWNSRGLPVVILEEICIGLFPRVEVADWED